MSAELSPDIILPFSTDHLPPLELFYKILLARGFFVELHEDHLTLSDNALIKSKKRRASDRDSQPDDLTFFIDTIERFKLGRIDSTWRFFPNTKLPENIIQQLFSPQHFKAETALNKLDAKWSFFTRLMSKKLPLFQIDSRVAILVKALSAVGCRTTMSCHGSVKQPAYLHFPSMDHLNWFYTLYRKVHKNTNAPFETKTTRCVIHFCPNPGETMQEVWAGLIQLGMDIYLQRFELRAYKEQLINICKQNSLTEFSLPASY